MIFIEAYSRLKKGGNGVQLDRSTGSFPRGKYAYYFQQSYAIDRSWIDIICECLSKNESNRLIKLFSSESCDSTEVKPALRALMIAMDCASRDIREEIYSLIQVLEVAADRGVLIIT